MSEELYHVGKPHEGGKSRSGRYKWGSGDTPFQNPHGFKDEYERLRANNLTELEIAKGMGFANTSELRAKRAIATNEARKDLAAQAMRYKDRGWSPTAIGREMGMNESSVRSLLDPDIQQRQNVLMKTAEVLRGEIKEKKALDVGAGAALELGITDTKLANAVAVLKEEGYKTTNLKVKDVNGHERTVKVLHDPSLEWVDLKRNPDSIKTMVSYSDDKGNTFKEYSTAAKFKSVDAKRLEVVYGDKGGEDRDGLIEIRRGVEDLSLGNARYAQVRIAVDDTHYLKGMAVYNDNLPAGVDIRFNTNKASGTPVKGAGDHSVLKSLKDDPDSPFKSVVRAPDMYKGKDGKMHMSSVNKVNEEGDWDKWSRRFSSQMLSKQSLKLVDTQLTLTRAQKKAEYEEIMALTNPIIRKKMLEGFSDSCDSASVHLKAAALPRSSNHVILPVPGLKPNEIYAPGYKDGERVVLIRHPHGGIFEIPELTVNNRNPAARKMIPSDAKDAIGIHPKAAKQLSGADFDGDSVLVIPNKGDRVKNVAARKELIDFDNRRFKLPSGSPRMKDSTLQNEMGKVSNLITDMTIRGASEPELFRAVKHSMVVIDSQKHELDYKASEKEFRIKELKQRYQVDPVTGKGGAGTLVSRAGSKVYVDEYKARTAAKGGPIDSVTGKKVYESTGTLRKVKNKETGEWQVEYEKDGTPALKQVKVKRLELADDARSLISGENTVVEQLYATHSNQLKAMANTARKEMVTTPKPKRDPQAAKEYAPEVAKLKAGLNTAMKVQPLERQALLIADAVSRERMSANPSLWDDPNAVKKLRRKDFERVKARLGIPDTTIEITPRQWEAIQKNAISPNMLEQIMSHTDRAKLTAMAMPKTQNLVTPGKKAQAQAMLNAGYTRAEVAGHLGVSVSTLDRSV